MKEGSPTPYIPTDDEPTGGTLRDKKVAEALDELVHDEIEESFGVNEGIPDSPVRTPALDDELVHEPTLVGKSKSTTLADIFPGFAAEFTRSSISADNVKINENTSGTKKEVRDLNSDEAIELHKYIMTPHEELAQEPVVSSAEEAPTIPAVKASIDGIRKPTSSKEGFQSRMRNNGEHSPYDEMTYRQLARDLVAGPVLERVVLEYLKHEDKGWTGEGFTGELTADGYLIRKDGAKPTLKPHECLGSIRDKDSLQTLDTVLDRTRKQLHTTSPTSLAEQVESPSASEKDLPPTETEPQENVTEGGGGSPESTPGITPSQIEQPEVSTSNTEENLDEPLPSAEMEVLEMSQEESVSGVTQGTTETSEVVPETTSISRTYINEMDFVAAASHPMAGKILEEQALRYLKENDSAYFNKEFTGEMDSEGYLIRRDGSTSSTKPSQNIGGGVAMEKVLERTKKELLTTTTEPQESATEQQASRVHETPEELEERGAKMVDDEEEEGEPLSFEDRMKRSQEKIEEEQESFQKGIDYQSKEEVPEVPTNITKETLDEPLPSAETPTQERITHAFNPELTAARLLAREKYRELRAEILKAKKEWEEVMQEYHDTQAQKGFIGKLFDPKHYKEQIREKQGRYLSLLEQVRSERENRMHAFMAGLDGKKGEPGEKETSRYAAFHEALLDRHIDQDIVLIERASIPTAQPESTARLLGSVRQVGRWYSGLSMKDKIKIGAGVGFVVGAAGAVATGSALAMLGLGTVAAARRAGGVLFTGTLGATMAGYVKGKADAIASKYIEKNLKETKDKETFAKTKLSDTFEQRINIQKKGKRIKTAGTIGAVGTVVGTAMVAGGSIAQGVQDALPENVQNAVEATRVAEAAAHTATETMATAPSETGDLDMSKFQTFPEPYDASQEHIEAIREATEVPDPQATLATGPTFETSSSIYTVKPGDNIWNILEKKLEENSHFKELTDTQRLQHIDALKDKIVAMSPEELKEIGIVSENPNLIHPGDRINLEGIVGDNAPVPVVEQVDSVVRLKGVGDVSESLFTPPQEPWPTIDVEATPWSDDIQSLTEQWIQQHEPVRSFGPIPDDVPAHVENINALPHEPTPVHTDPHENFSKAEISSANPEILPTSLTSESSPAQPLTSTSSLGEQQERLTGADVRLGDFPHAQADFEQARAGIESSELLTTRPYIERLFTEENIFSRTVEGKYNMVRGNWGIISRLGIQDVFDGDQKLTLSTGRGPAFVMGVDAESLVRSMLVQTENGLVDRVPNVKELLAQAHEENWTVGKFYDAVGKQLEASDHPEVRPEPVATLASLDATPEVANVQNSDYPPTAPQETPVTNPPASTNPSNVTAPWLDVKIHTAGENEHMLGGVDAELKIGGGGSIHEVNINTEDDIAASAALRVKDLMNKNPQWGNQTPGELIRQGDTSFEKIWNLNKLELKTKGVLNATYDGTDTSKAVDMLEKMPWHEALRQLQDHIHDQVPRYSRPTIYNRY